MRPVSPRGFRDVLFEEAAERRSFSRALLDVFDAWGFRLVETPVVEEFSVLETGAGAGMDRKAFRLLDMDGSLLALRPEMTVPIARLVAAHLEPSMTARLCYLGPVFREQASLRGESRQFTQAGVELIGASGPSADAEVVCVMAEALRAAGLREFTIAIGSVAVLRKLIEKAGRGEEWAASVMDAAHERNLVAIDALTEGAGLDDTLTAALCEVPRTRGGIEALERCEELTAGLGCEPELEALRLTWEAARAAGAAPFVMLDFGILRSFDYYTGMVLEAYAPGLGLPLGGGGRYDGVLARFGADLPAAGFAIGLERLHIALEQQGALPEPAGTEVLVGGDDACAVFAKAAELRRQGRRVMLWQGDPDDLETEARRLGARALRVSAFAMGDADE